MRERTLAPVTSPLGTACLYIHKYQNWGSSAVPYRRDMFSLLNKSSNLFFPCRGNINWCTFVIAAECFTNATHIACSFILWRRPTSNLIFPKMCTVFGGAGWNVFFVIYSSSVSLGPLRASLFLSYRYVPRVFRLSAYTRYGVICRKYRK